jgi:outer membrane protein assembly factor BamB
LTQEIKPLTFAAGLWYGELLAKIKETARRGGIMKKPVPKLVFVAALTLAAALYAVPFGAGCTPTIEKLWEFPISSPIYSTPLVVGDLIVFGSESGTLHAVDKNGQARWRYQVSSSQIFSRPATDGKLIYFGATNQTFYAVDLKGQLKWKFVTGERIKSDPALLEGVVYTSSYDGHVYALQTDTGKEIWEFPPKEPPREAAGEGDEEKEKPEETSVPSLDPKPGAFSYSAPVIKDGVLYVGNLDGYLYAIQTADGKLKWRFKAGGGITSSPLVEGKAVYFGSKDDHVYAVDAATGGKTLWKFKTGDDVLSSPRIYDGVLFIGSNDKNFYALDAKTGKKKCHFATKGPVISYGAFFQDLVFFGGGQGDGNVYALNRSTCELFFSTKTGYKIESDPILEGDRLYVTSGDMQLYAFKINKKK